MSHFCTQWTNNSYRSYRIISIHFYRITGKRRRIFDSIVVQFLYSRILQQFNFCAERSRWLSNHRAVDSVFVSMPPRSEVLRLNITQFQQSLEENNRTLQSKPCPPYATPNPLYIASFVSAAGLICTRLTSNIGVCSRSCCHI